MVGVPWVVMGRWLDSEHGAGSPSFGKGGLGVTVKSLLALGFLAMSACAGQVAGNDPCWHHMFDTTLSPACSPELARDRQACDSGDTAACLDYMQVQARQRQNAQLEMQTGAYLAAPPQNRYGVVGY